MGRWEFPRQVLISLLAGYPALLANWTSGTFKDGNVFKASVNADAAIAPAGFQVGEAANNFHSFNIFRADGSNIYSIDGWNVFAIYQCL